MRGGVTEIDGAGEKFHFVGMLGNAFSDMERMTLSNIQFKKLGNQVDMKA